MQYQVQEMLRAERIFEPEGIAEELECLQSADPGRQQLKATLLIEFPDAPSAQRRARASSSASRTAAGCRCAATSRVYRDRRRGPGARERREDLLGAFPALRVHSRDDRRLKSGAALAAGVDHDHYRHTVDPVPEPGKAALLADLN